MNWLRRLMLAHFPHLRRYIAPSELETTWPKHRRRVQKADRVINEYAKLDGALQLYVSRRK